MLRASLAGLLSVFALLTVPAGASALTWHGPQTIAPPGAERPGVAIDDRGAVVAVWSRGGTIEAAFREPAGTFGPIQVVGEGVDPDIAVAGDGTAVVTWMGQHPGWTVRAAVRPSGGTFGAPIDLAVVDTSFPQVVMNRRGDALVAWPSGGQSIAASRRMAGQGFEAPRLVQPATGHFQVGIDGEGDATAVWERFVTFSGEPSGAGNFHIEAADLLHDATAWSPVEVLSSADGQLPRLEVGEDGTAVMTMIGFSPPRLRVRPPGGTWSPAAAVVPASYYPAVAVHDDGRVHLGFHDEGADAMRTQALDPDGSLLAPVTVGAEEGGLVHTRIGLAGDGTQILAWRFATGFGKTGPLRAAFVTPGGAVDVQTLPYPSGFAADELLLATSWSGRAVALSKPVSGPGPIVAWMRDDAWPTEPSRAPQPLGPATPDGPAADAPGAPHAVAPDRRAPGLVPSTARRISTDATRVRVRVSCDEACLVRVTGDVDPRGRARRRKLPTTSGIATVGRHRILTVKLSKAVRRALHRARGGQIRLRVVAVDAAANRTATRTLRITVSARR